MDFVNKLSRWLDIHPLLIEEAKNTKQRPKIEEFEGYIFIILKMLGLTEEFEVSEEQVSLIFTSDTVVSFQEKPEGVFNIVRDRLRSSKRVIRKMGTDYLAYNLLDARYRGLHDSLL
jgi:magnesium transporter